MPQTRHHLPRHPAAAQRLRAQGVLTAVITNKPQPQADALRESTFHGMLDAIWGQREGFPLKPDPTLAQELIRELEARPVAYVGDSQVDISLGKNLGLPTVLMTWGSRTPAELLAADPSAILADTAASWKPGWSSIWPICNNGPLAALRGGFLMIK